MFECQVFRMEELIEDSFYVSHWRQDCHFTWSSDPRKSLAVCSKRSILISHFLKNLSFDSIPGIDSSQPLPLQSRALRTELVPQHPLYEYLLEKKTDFLHVVESLPVSNKCLHTNSVFIGGRVEK